MELDLRERNTVLNKLSLINWERMRKMFSVVKILMARWTTVG